MSLSPSVLKTDIDLLCKSMPAMPGCALQKVCGTHSDGFCSLPSIYGTLCTDMPRMGGCKDFASCTDCKPTSLPTSRNVTESIYSICTEMEMDGCSNCKIRPGAGYAECDLMGTYSQLCNDMPNMPQCSFWKTMCASTPVPGWCPNAPAIGGPSSTKSAETPSTKTTEKVTPAPTVSNANSTDTNSTSILGNSNGASLYSFSAFILTALVYTF